MVGSKVYRCPVCGIQIAGTLSILSGGLFFERKAEVKKQQPYARLLSKINSIIAHSFLLEGL